MKNKIMISIVVALVASLTLAPLAFASSPTHTVHCEGTGYAYLHGNASLTVTARTGSLTYHDIGGDGKLAASGYGRKVSNGSWTYLYGFHGWVKASGSDIAVFLTGTRVTLDASGTGVLRVRGVGSCTIDGQPYKWTPTLTEVKLGE